MHITLTHAEFSRAVERGIALVDKKNSLPVLNGILLRAEQDGTLWLEATNLESGVRMKLTGDIHEPGKIVIPAAKLYEIAREIPDGQVTLSTDSDTHRITLETTTATFKLAGLPADDFPNLPEPETSSWTQTFQGDALKRAIAQTMYCVSRDESRYALTGVYFDIHLPEGQMDVVATDGHRMACHRLPIEKGDGMMPGKIIPVKTAAELKKLCDSGDITVFWDDTMTLFRVGDVELMTRVIDANFPDYRQVVPEMTTSATVMFARSDFLAVIRRVSLLTSDTRLMKCTFGTDTATFRCDDPNMGEAVENLNYTGGFPEQSIVFGLNAKYVIETVSTLSSEYVNITVNDALSPVLIGSPDDQNLTTVIMPMRV